ncbi:MULTISPECIES: 50S ribosomal protein L24 [unclassified Gemella]|uniref:50S ribosomal protein L24 n=1 Tax=unclassified Gemella TaxID=2624949 RepID=UPI001072F8AC|nr:MULTISPECIES: 50S ribosomal protein L24 [unclassified Gemella]MBF0709917.1 50S ribosomal protein L24 [Gemella sp. GL1.1]MBF0746779.1 50S ribosomal protein L24 [Gemella sp. 19428wG2_WT2a]NYS27261.1 50S ribosomal protein L24 [Gemella sp. GL1]TFU59504.1 50S ribosomal protein L24 [Gemella sp. WT2a]
MFIKKGDKVVVITGKDKGKVGIVKEALPKEDRVVVEGVNIVKKHTKSSQEAPQGGRIEFEAPVHVSNVMLQDPETGKPTRVGFEVKDGKKVRISKKSGKEI